MIRSSSVTRLLAAPLFFVVVGIRDVRAAEEFPVPVIGGLELVRREVIEIAGAPKPIAFKFNDGRICMPSVKGGSLWSEDAGKMWRDGPPGPLDKMAFDFG